jgi:hypothetical protein
MKIERFVEIYREAIRRRAANLAELEVPKRNKVSEKEPP